MLIIGKHLFGAGYIFGFAFQVNAIGAQVNGDIQAVFQHVQIFIAGAEQGFDVWADLNTFLHLESGTRLQRSANSAITFLLRRKQSSLAEVDQTGWPWDKGNYHWAKSTPGAGS